MNEVWEVYEKKLWVEPLLIFAILLFVTFSLVLFVLLLISRNSKNKKQILSAEYDDIIENILIAILFSGMEWEAVQKDPQFKKLHKNLLFRDRMMSQVINLHKNYEGDYAKKLEQFYFASELISDSFVKIKSRKWEVNCKGINELAEMNVTKLFNVLVKVSRTNNRILQITALNACVRLNGTNGLAHLLNHPHPIDEWTQLNIIAALKPGDIENTAGIELLLGSQNNTVVSLGLKIIQTLFLSQHIPVIAQLVSNATNEKVRAEAKSVIVNLNIHLNPAADV